MIRSIPAVQLKQGMVLALPAGRTATVQFPPAIGTKFVTFATEYGKTRVDRYDEVIIEVTDDDN